MMQNTKETRGEYILKAIAELSLGGDAYHTKQAIRKESLKKKAESITAFESDFSLLVQQGLLHQEGDRIYLMETWQYESFVAERVCSILRTSGIDTKHVLPTTLRVKEKMLTDEQRAAVALALNHPLCMILGGAGTGKTTLIEVIVDQCRFTHQYGMCAPTGKAARNLSERSDLSAATVYSMLHMTPDDHMLDARPIDGTPLVIIDEASMLTIKEFAGILEAAGPCSKIVLLGDPNQLLSVGSGNIIPDLLELGVPSIRLSTCHRQAGEERALLHNVRSFDTCYTIGDLQYDDTFSVLETQSAEVMLRYIAEEGTLRYHRGESVQVVAPTNNMVFSLNCRMQEKLNPVRTDSAGRALEIEVLDKHKRRMKLRDGDRVMMLRNNYGQDYCNGDTGTLYINNSHEDEIDYGLVFPDGRKCNWNNRTGLRDMTLGYSITIHKSQGSEYDTILMPIVKSRMLNRNLVYTAFSRAKKQVLMVGDREALEAGLRTYPEPRKSGLVERVERARRKPKNEYTAA